MKMMMMKMKKTKTKKRLCESHWSFALGALQPLVEPYVAYHTSFGILQVSSRQQYCLLLLGHN